MTDLPILFSAPMVRALLDGRKTQTRRVLKPQPVNFASVKHFNSSVLWVATPIDYNKPMIFKSPPHAIGDRLWVREAFYEEPPRTIQPAPGERLETFTGEIFYRADDDKLPGVLWKPSIHMPRWASRITLTVTDVRVQRVQEIGCDSIYREGFTDYSTCDPARADFVSLWNSLNAKRGFGWDANPWVAAYTFERTDNRQRKLP